MALSLTMSAVADETNASEALTENVPEISASVTEPDELLVYEDPAEAVEPRYADHYEYLQKIRVKTSGGSAGYVTIEFGIYKMYRELGGGHSEFWNYGVSAVIVDTSSDGSNLKAEITISADAHDVETTYYTTDMANADRLFVSFPKNYNIINIDAFLTVRSDAFGYIMNKELHANC